MYDTRISSALHSLQWLVHVYAMLGYSGTVNSHGSEVYNKDETTSQPSNNSSYYFWKCSKYSVGNCIEPFSRFVKY